MGKYTAIFVFSSVFRFHFRTAVTKGLNKQEWKESKVNKKKLNEEKKKYKDGNAVS